MRRAALGVACLLLLAVAAQPAEAATKRERICAKRGTTAAASKVARVFEVDRGGDRSLFGCMRAGGRRQLLSSWFSCDCSTGDDPAPDVTLHARRFAEVVEHESCGPVPDPACGGSTASLRDLRERRTYAVQDRVGEVVARVGSFAYTDGRVVLVRGRTATVVGEGPAEALAFSRARLYWTTPDGLPHSAPLQ